MIEGLNNTQIAGRLIFSPSTVKSHISNILSKLRVASRTETVTLALQHSIVTCPHFSPPQSGGDEHSLADGCGRGGFSA
jgi:hypothetical protein